MAFLSVALLLVALLGHTALWAAVVNRLHGTSLARPMMDVLTLAIFLCTVGVPAVLLVGAIWTRVSLLSLDQWLQAWRPLTIYAAVCWGEAVLVSGAWLRRHWWAGAPAALRYDRRRSVESLAIHSDEHHRIVNVPGNQAVALDVVERAVEILHLPGSLDGLTIVHFSDLHFTGRIGKSYFRQVVQLSNELEPDLVMITGDLVDSVGCLDWIPEILAPLEARYGKFVVLGNHDHTVGADAVRSAVRASGLTDVGGRWLDVAVRDQRVIVAGNELPWFPPAADLTNAPPPLPDGPLRIALAHTPDRVSWARANRIDLLLAGHTHGGQICLPWIGPILTPSLWGVSYSWGTFHLSPTILHVTRGVSGVYPVRVNCPPELVKLVLHAK